MNPEHENLTAFEMLHLLVLILFHCPDENFLKTILMTTVEYVHQSIAKWSTYLRQRSTISSFNSFTTMSNLFFINNTHQLRNKK